MEKIKTFNQKPEIWKSAIDTLKEAVTTFRVLGDKAMEADNNDNEDLAIEHYQHRAAVIANLDNKLKEMSLEVNSEEQRKLIEKIGLLSAKAKPLALADPKNVSLMKLSMIIGPYGGEQYNELEKIVNEFEQPVNAEQEKPDAETLLNDQYFYNKYEKNSIDANESVALLKKLRRPLVELDLSDENNSATISSGELGIDMKFSKAKYSASMRQYDNLNDDEKKIENNWRELADLKIKYREQEINLGDYLPDDWRIVFHTSSNYDVDASNSMSEKTIAVSEKLDNLASLFAMFHEIGHVQTFQKMSNEDFLQLVNDSKDLALNFRGGKKIDSSAIDNALKGERDAWAVAIKMIKPFIKSGLVSRIDVVNYIHKTGEALGSYSKFISSLIERDLIIDETREEISIMQ